MWHLLKDMRKKDKGLAFLAVLLIAGQVFLDLKLPDYTKEITVLISSESNTISDYLLSGGKMLACALGSALLAVIVGYLAAKIAADFSHNVRGKVFHKVFDFGAGEISKFSTSSLITRTTNDITQIQMLVAMGLQVMSKAPIMAAWAIVKIVGKSWQLSVLTASAVVLIMVVIGTLMAVLLPKFKTVQKQVDDVNPCDPRESDRTESGTCIQCRKISGRQIRKRQRKSDENADVHHAWHGISVPGDDFCTECIISWYLLAGSKTGR